MAEPEVFTETTAAPGLTPKRLRYLFASDLFHMIPEIENDMIGRPGDKEPTLGFMDRMLESGTPEESVTTAAHALQPRQAVLWALECLQGISGILNSVDQDLVEQVKRWMVDGEDHSREIALKASMDAEIKTPGVWLAFAAACSEDASVPAEHGVAAVPDHLTGRALNACILSALARIDPAARSKKLSEIASLAKVFASGH